MKRVLIIEDEADVRDVYTQYLRDSGYDVIEAEDGITGLKQATEVAWDIMLLDIMLPGEDGLQLLKKLKALEGIKDRPVIALTNLNIDSVINEMFDAGADAFLVKSEITPDKIVSEIEAVLQKYA